MDARALRDPAFWTLLALAVGARFWLGGTEALPEALAAASSLRRFAEVVFFLLVAAGIGRLVTRSSPPTE